MRRVAWMTAAAAALGVLLASCTPYPHAGQNRAGGADTGGVPDTTTRASVDTMEQLRGKLFVTGSEPMTTVTLQRDDGGAIALTGELEPELRRLTGATVAVHGTRVEHPPMGGFDVHQYEVLLIDGQRPYVGILLHHGETTWLAGADTVELADTPEALSAQPGAKVWIIGERMGDALAVQSYGIIRARTP
jgi:hypothetical protein